MRLSLCSCADVVRERQKNRPMKTSSPPLKPSTRQSQKQKVPNGLTFTFLSCLMFTDITASGGILLQFLQVLIPLLAKFHLANT